MNSELSPRLAAVARMAAGARILADVGCDHGLLSIYMLTHGWAQTAVASDLRPGPLSTARRNAAGCGLAGRIRFELADGLDFPGADVCDAVVCAGMGGETIAGILRRAPWTKDGARLILQPQSKLDELCLWLRADGYAVLDAALAAEGERLYAALLVRGGADGFKWAEDALARNGDPLLGRWLQDRLGRLERAIEGMERGADASSEIAAAQETAARLRASEGGKT